MKRYRRGAAWVRPERRRLVPACDADAAEAMHRAGRIARSAVLLGMKLTRAALDEGIRLLESPRRAEAAPPEHIEKIDIK